MSILSDPDREDVWAQTMRDFSSIREDTGGLNKADLRAAIDATDQWIEDNAAAYNLALPVAARTALTAGQKLRVFMAVANRRFEVE